MNFKADGIWTALATPFSADGSLDLAAFKNLVRLQARGGVAGVVVGGSTGEGASLEPYETAELVREAVREGRGRLLVAAGVGANVTQRAVQQALSAKQAGAQGLLVTAPSYLKPTQEGLYAHFRDVARAAGIPIMVYNIPGRTAVTIEPSTLARLGNALPNVVAVKESSGSVEQAARIIAAVPRRVSLLAGDDGLILPMLAVGARGGVSVLSNIAPEAAVALWKSFASGRTEKARALHHKALPLIQSLFLESNPIPLKAALHMMGLAKNVLRLPLTPLSEPRRPLLRAALRDFGIL